MIEQKTLPVSLIRLVNGWLNRLYHRRVLGGGLDDLVQTR